MAPHFLAFPPEIRLRIYEFLASASDDIHCHVYVRPGLNPNKYFVLSKDCYKRRYLVLLSVCKLIYREIRPVIYSRKVFHIPFNPSQCSDNDGHAQPSPRTLQTIETVKLRDLRRHSSFELFDTKFFPRILENPSAKIYNMYYRHMTNLKKVIVYEDITVMELKYDTELRGGQRYQVRELKEDVADDKRIIQFKERTGLMCKRFVGMLDIYLRGRPVIVDFSISRGVFLAQVFKAKETREFRRPLQFAFATAKIGNEFKVQAWYDQAVKDAVQMKGCFEKDAKARINWAYDAVSWKSNTAPNGEVKAPKVA